MYRTQRLNKKEKKFIWLASCEKFDVVSHSLTQFVSQCMSQGHRREAKLHHTTDNSILTH